MGAGDAVSGGALSEGSVEVAAAFSGAVWLETSAGSGGLQPTMTTALAKKKVKKGAAFFEGIGIVLNGTLWIALGGNPLEISQRAEALQVFIIGAMGT